MQIQIEGNIDAHPWRRACCGMAFWKARPWSRTARRSTRPYRPSTCHVFDADSSQTVAIAEAAGGRTLVVKGAPGTGKSQTITNIIAAAVARGKKVMFVAEKMAALDVVHRRLRQVGLGPLTLELHSNKVNKRTVLEELQRTRDAQHRPPRGDLSVIQKLGDTGAALNAFTKRLHTPPQPRQLTPQAILARLAKSQQRTPGPLLKHDVQTIAPPGKGGPSQTRIGCGRLVWS